MMLSINVAITSLPPNRARKSPAIELHAAPPKAPASSRIGIAMNPGAFSWAPMTPAIRPPMMSCPSAPMLKSPARNAKAMPSEGKSSDVVCTSVSASCDFPPSAPWKSA